MCTWLLEFSEQTPWMQTGEQTGGASCNMVVRKSDFLEEGGFPEAYQPGEDTVLFAKLRNKGLQQWFVSSARVDHFNHSGFLPFYRQMRKLGYQSAQVRQRLPLKGALATRIRLLAFTMWVPKFTIIFYRVMREGPKSMLRALYYSPGILVGSCIWTSGFISRVYKN